MIEETKAYIEFIGKMQQVVKPKLPKFDERAYTENEYVRATRQIENDFMFADSFNLTIQHLKGE